MNKIRLVHFTSSLKIGGAEKVLFDLVTNLDQNKYEQAIIYIHDGPYRNKLQLLGFSTFQISGFVWHYDPWLLVRLWRLMRKLKPNVIHTMLWIANLTGRIIAKVLRIPSICVMHNHNKQNGFVRNILDLFTIRTASAIVAVSHEVAQSVVHTTWIPAKKIIIIPNGIALNQKSKQVSRSILGFTTEHFIIGSVGRFHPVKRYDLLLKVFAQMASLHTHIRLVLLGIGKQEQKLRLLTDKLGITNLVKFIIGQSAQNYYSLFDCFVQTSAQEGISIALLEAMSFRLPCVVMNSNYRHSVIRPGKTGLVVHADDMQGLVAAIEQLMLNDSLAKRLGEHAQTEVKAQFALNTMIRSYDSLFENAGLVRD